MYPRSLPYPPQAAHDVLGDSPVVGQLATQLLDHAIDVIQLRLVAREDGPPIAKAHHARGHVAVDAVHDRLVVVLLLSAGQDLRMGMGLGLSLSLSLGLGLLLLREG